MDAFAHYDVHSLGSVLTPTTLTSLHHQLPEDGGAEASLAKGQRWGLWGQGVIREGSESFGQGGIL